MFYREHFTHPEKLAKLIQIEINIDIERIIKGIAQELMDETEGDTRTVYEYFSVVYEDLYHSIIFEKIHLQKQTLLLLEFLATPPFEKSIQEQRELLEKYIS